LAPPLPRADEDDVDDGDVDAGDDEVDELPSRRASAGVDGALELAEEGAEEEASVETKAPAPSSESLLLT
jgi:hypothetical protein